MKLAVFDVDSTLIDAETIEKLASIIGLEEEVRKVTTRAMQGELDFFESLTYRVSLLKGVDEKKVNVNLVESKESHKSWKNDFLDENNLEETTLLLVKNLLQEDYKGEWINTVYITYEGEDIN